MKHTESCLKAQAALAEFEAAHPKYCRKCLGAGETRSPQTWEEPENIETCECVMSDHCPLCGSTIVWENDEVGTCSNPECEVSKCAINGFDAPNWPTAPDIDCSCWEEAAEAEYSRNQEA